MGEKNTDRPRGPLILEITMSPPQAAGGTALYSRPGYSYYVRGRTRVVPGARSVHWQRA